jgi:hypothetical protein
MTLMTGTCLTVKALARLLLLLLVVLVLVLVLVGITGH